MFFRAVFEALPSAALLLGLASCPVLAQTADTSRQPSARAVESVAFGADPLGGPVLQDDAAAVHAGGEVRVDVLDNDTLAGGTVAAVVIRTAPACGRAWVEADRIAFAATERCAGEVSIVYGLNDDPDGTAAELLVSIAPPGQRGADPERDRATQSGQSGSCGPYSGDLGLVEVPAMDFAVADLPRDLSDLLRVQQKVNPERVRITTDAFCIMLEEFTAQMLERFLPTQIARADIAAAKPYLRLHPTTRGGMPAAGIDLGTARSVAGKLSGSVWELDLPRTDEYVAAAYHLFSNSDPEWHTFLNSVRVGTLEWTADTCDAVENKIPAVALGPRSNGAFDKLCYTAENFETQSGFRLVARRR